MGMNYIDAGMLKNAFLAGAKGLEANKEWINEPVSYTHLPPFLYLFLFDSNFMP